MIAKIANTDLSDGVSSEAFSEDESHLVSLKLILELGQIRGLGQ